MQDNGPPRIYSTIDPAEGSVTLSLDPHHFREFISGLLGQPQKTERKMRLSYHLRPEDIADLYQLVLQRVEAQNGSALTDVSFRLDFSDASSVTLKTMEELLTFNAIRPVRTNIFRVQWTFLVQFPHKSAPERQGVLLEFREYIYAPSRPSPISSFLGENTGEIYYAIEYTDRSWSVDMDNLLENYLKSLAVKLGPFVSIMTRYSTLVVFMGYIAIDYMIYAPISRFLTREFMRPLTESSIAWARLGPVDKVNAKLDYILFHTPYDNGALPLIYVLVSIMVLPFIVIIFDRVIQSAKPKRLIVLTKSDREAFDREALRVRHQSIAGVATIAVPLFIGLAANWISKTWL